MTRVNEADTADQAHTADTACTQAPDFAVRPPRQDPATTLVIALVLGPIFEANFHIATRLHQLGRINFWTRPIVLVLLGLSVACLVLPYLQGRRASHAKEPAS